MEEYSKICPSGVNPLGQDRYRQIPSFELAKNHLSTWEVLEGLDDVELGIYNKVCYIMKFDAFGVNPKTMFGRWIMGPG